MPKGGLLGAAAVALLATVASALPSLFELDRAAVVHGEIWRLWTGHLVHASRDHLIFDVGAACLFFIALGQPARAAFHFAWLAPAIGFVLLAALPGLDVYYGLSSILHAWAVAGAGEVWLREHGTRSHLAAAFGLGTIAKAAWETWTASPTCSGGLDMGGPVIFAAHLVGAMAGLVLVAARIRASRRDLALSYRRDPLGPRQMCARWVHSEGGAPQGERAATG